MIGELFFKKCELCVLSWSCFPPKASPLTNPLRATIAPTFGEILPASLLRFRARSIALSIRSLSLTLTDDLRECADLAIYSAFRVS